MAGVAQAKTLVAPCRVILKHYRCDTPRDAFSVGLALPPKCAMPLSGTSIYTDTSVRYPVLRHNRAILAQYPIKTSMNELCNERMARYEKHRCWASEDKTPFAKSILVAPSSGLNAIYLCFTPSTLSAPKSQRFLRFAIAMPIADPRNR